MTNEMIFNNTEMLSMEELDQVAGGNAIDRAMIVSSLEKKGLKPYLVYGKDNEDTLKKTCRKYGIEYKANTFSFDEFKINGTWRSSIWLKDHQDETVAFIKKKIGI